jgi:hypothetical protein
MKIWICTVVVALTGLICAPTRAYAWGRDGHEIVARIAEARLTPKAKAGVEALLGKDKSMVSVANWADAIRKDREETGPWHYVNIPYEMRGFDEARDGKNGDNVVDKIVEFANVLNDRKRSDADREEALKFLIHFVGDLHQPLHSTERNDDKGGNFRLVFFLNQSEAVNLHRVWDSEILKRMMKTGPTDLSADEMAARINESITEKQVREWTRSDPVAWVNESHKLAVEIVYADIPADGPPPKIAEAYLTRAEPVIEMQLARAGVRLADVLNRVFQ